MTLFVFVIQTKRMDFLTVKFESSTSAVLIDSHIFRTR